MELKIKEMEIGDKFSELSHYTLSKIGTSSCEFTHEGSGETVKLQNKYVLQFLKNAEQYQTEVVVGREDKFWTAKQVQDGIKKKLFTKKNAPEVGSLRQKGIRTIWEEIHSAQVFTVGFMTQPRETKAELTRRREEAVDAIISRHGRLGSGTRKADREIYIKNVIMDALNSPVIKEPKLRELRGYKVQFTSRDGRYDCVDMDIAENNVRPVNINTLQYLVFDGVKYVVK